jgi:hypothetical protein
MTPLSRPYRRWTVGRDGQDVRRTAISVAVLSAGWLLSTARAPPAGRLSLLTIEAFGVDLVHLLSSPDTTGQTSRSIQLATQPPQARVPGQEKSGITGGKEVADPTVAMEIARKVAQWEIEKYHEAAWTVVESRLEEFRSEVIKRIHTLDPKRLECFKDPDVQMTLRDAQRSYARSGRPDVCRTLVDLVAARCSTQSGGFQAAVISEAVEAVRKLTPTAIAALTVSFILTRGKALGVTSPDQLIAWLIGNVGPFIDELPSGVHEYEFLEATRSASISPAEYDLPGNTSRRLRRTASARNHTGTDSRSTLGCPRKVNETTICSLPERPK